MDRKFAFLTAGLLTGVILVVVFALVEPASRGSAMSAPAVESAPSAALSAEPSTVSSPESSTVTSSNAEAAAEYMRTLEAALK